jgi:C4-dicarboxylate transporter, DctM subunit
MAVLPLAEMVARRFFGVGVPGSGPLVQHLTLWVAFLGAAIAARQGRLLALTTQELLPAGHGRELAGAAAAAVGAAVSALLFRGSLDLVLIEREVGATIALGIPVWVAQAVMPIAFALIAFRLVRRASERWPGLQQLGEVTGGAAAALFLAAGIPIAALPVETYRLAVSPTLAAIPLFTLAGFLLAEGKAPKPDSSASNGSS